MKPTRSLEEYEWNQGWSSNLFFREALPFFKLLKSKGVRVDFYRTVVHIGSNLKCYVHYNGRSKEYATLTDSRGQELLTVHCTEIDQLKSYILSYLNIQVR